MSTDAVKFVWLDGRMVDARDANVPVSTLALHYGIGFFEGIRCHATAAGPALFRLRDHLARLRRSAAVYGVTLPYDEETLAAACAQVVVDNGLTDCYVRPLVFLGEGANPLAAPFRCAILASPGGPLAGGARPAGVTAQISSFQRFGANALPPAAKATGQYLNAFLAIREAVRGGHDEAILLNEAGYVADGWAHNVFVVESGTLVTPPLWTGGLPGITRDSLLKLAAENAIPTAERPLVRSDLYLADECLLTGTAVGVAAVTRIDGRPVGAGVPGPVGARLAKLLTEAVTGAATAHPEWLEYAR